MHIQDFFQNFLKLVLVGLHGNCTISLIAHMSPKHRASLPHRERRIWGRRLTSASRSRRRSSSASRRRYPSVPSSSSVAPAPPPLRRSASPTLQPLGLLVDLQQRLQLGLRPPSLRPSASPSRLCHPVLPLRRPPPPTAGPPPPRPRSGTALQSFVASVSCPTDGGGTLVHNSPCSGSWFRMCSGYTLYSQVVSYLRP